MKIEGVQCDRCSKRDYYEVGSDLQKWTTLVGVGDGDVDLCPTCTICFKMFVNDIREGRG